MKVASAHIPRFLEKILRDYFNTSQRHGLCEAISKACRATNEKLKNDSFQLEPCDLEEHTKYLFHEIGKEWEYAPRYSNNSFSCFMVPVSRKNIDPYDAESLYLRAMNRKEDMRNHSMRLELANFVIRQICRKQKRKFIPIQFP